MTQRGYERTVNRSYGAMAARWIPDPKVGGSNPSSFIFFFPYCVSLKQKKKKRCRNWESHPGCRGYNAEPCYLIISAVAGHWRIRVSIPVLNLAKVVCYHVQQSPTPIASIGTRTRIFSLEGVNTTLVLWTLVTFLLLETTSCSLDKEKNKKSPGGEI